MSKTTETQEAIPDIITEIRTKAECAKPYDDGIVMMLTDFADRLETAHKREQSQSWHHREMEELVLRHEKELVDAKKSSGDAAKLREALGKILWCLEWMFNNTDDKSVQSHLIEPIALAKAALAEPVKNYEVGTPEEQSKRFKFSKCDEPPKCRPWDECCLTCFAKWAQMPYEEGGAK